MRLFVAIALDDAAKGTLHKAQGRAGRACSGVRWTPAEQMHLTLKFLGEVRDGDVACVAEALRAAATEASPFEMEIRGYGCFPPKGPVRIVWAGVREESGSLLRLVGGIEDRLEDLGFARERRPFSAHITIGRVRDDRSGGGIRSAVAAVDGPSASQPVSSVSLISSILASEGPTYTPVSTAELRGGPCPQGSEDSE